MATAAVPSWGPHIGLRVAGDPRPCRPGAGQRGLQQVLGVGMVTRQGI